MTRGGASLEVRLRGLGDGAEGEGNGRLGLGIRGDPEDKAEGEDQNRQGDEDTDNGEHAEDEETREERLGGITHAANFGAGKALDSRNHLTREGYDGFDTGKHPGFEGADLRVRRVGHRVLRPEDGTSRSGTGRFTLRGAWIDKRGMAGDWDMALGLGRRGGRGLGGNLITGEGEGLLFGGGLRGGRHRFGRRLRLNGGLGHRPRRRRGRRRNGRRGLNLGGARSIGTRGGSGQDLGLGNGGEGGLGWLNKLMRRGGPRRCRGVRRKGAATTGMDGLERALGEVVNGGADGRGAGGVGADGGVFVKQGLRINLEEGAVLTDKAAAVDGGGDFVEGFGFEGFDDAGHEVGALGDVLHGPAVRKTVLLEGLTECHWGPRGLGGE